MKLRAVPHTSYEPCDLFVCTPPQLETGTTFLHTPPLTLLELGLIFRTPLNPPESPPDSKIAFSHQFGMKFRRFAASLNRRFIL